MARRDALLRIHQTLSTRRNELLKRLGVDLRDLRTSSSGSNGTGDTVDAAFDTGAEEIAGTLAELEAKELHQIERAINRMKQGKYGLCEACASRIPVERLNFLPYSTLCVACQRDQERGGGAYRGGVAWDKVTDGGGDDREVDLSALELDLSRS